ncbi:DNA mismatch repair [Nucleospora cyclopteri]
MKAQQYIHNSFLIVKELVENSLDAEATCIKITITEDEIVTEDNGKGISKNDANLLGTACCTSKDSTTNHIVGIENNSDFSYGFRGQALASTAEMCSVEIVTASNNEGLGFKKDLGSKVIQEIARERGTTVKIKNLFYNCPIRKNLNKKTFKKNIVNIAEYLETFSYVFNGSMIFTYEYGKNKKKQIVYKGDENIRKFAIKKLGISVMEIKNDFFDLFLFPENKQKVQKIFSGKRPIKSNLVKLVEKTFLKYEDHSPSFILIIKDAIDINISPDKSEVYFQNKEIIENRLKSEIDLYMINKKDISTFSTKPKRTKLGEITNTYQGIKENKDDCNKIGISSPASIKINKADFKQMTIIGQFNQGFIICQLQKEDKKHCIIIDQHAADEIFNYEKLQNTFRLSKQKLINPLKVDLTDYQKLYIEEYRQTFDKNGFTFDENFSLITMPQYKDCVFNKSDFFDLLKKVMHEDDKDEQICDKFKDIMASKACRTSIMIGSHLTTKKMQGVVENLSNLRIPWKCPHGRPTFIVLNKNYNE